MTLRLCIFGNSHLAALRDAWGRNPGRWPGVAVTFLAAPKDYLLQTRVQDGRLVAIHPAARAVFSRLCGLSEVSLADHDALVVAGASIGVPAIMPLYRDMRWTGLIGFDHPLPPRQAQITLVSAAAARAAMASVLQQRLGYVFASRLRQFTARPILLTAQPRVSDIILTNPGPATRLHNLAVQNGDGAAIGQVFDQVATKVLADLQTVFLPQPTETVTRGILTKLSYMTDAKRLNATMDAPQPQADVMHANSLYGALLFDQIIQAL